MRGSLHLGLLLGALLLVPRGASAIQPGKRFEQYAHAAWPSVAHASTVSAVTPSRAGHLWLGTSDGVVRFDGQRMSTLEGPPFSDITANRNLRALYEARNGALWIASAGKGMSRLKDQTVHSWRGDERAPGDFVISFVEDARGTMWVAGKRGVARFPAAHDLGSPGVPSSEGLSNRCTHALAITGAGPLHEQTLWAGTHAGVARLQDGRWVYEAGPLARATVDVLLGEPDGTLWVGTRGAGLFQLRAGQWRNFGVAEGLGSNDVSALLRDRAGHLWVATKGSQRGTLAWLDGERFRAFPLPARMCGDRIESLAEDAEGGLWIGTEVCGLHRLADRIFDRLTSEDGLPSDQVLGMRPDRAGGALVGTRGGGLAQVRVADAGLPGQSARTVIDRVVCAPGLPCNECWDFSPMAPLRHDEPARFWVDCQPNRVLRWDGRAMSPYAELPDHMPGASFVLEARDGAVWFALEKKVVRRHQGTAAPMREQEPFEGYRILFEGQDGAMFIAADDGMAIWRAGKTELLPLPAAERPSEVANFHQDPDGTLWMATKGQGIRRLRQGRIATVGVEHGLPGGWIVQLLEDSQGRLWASSSKGLFWVHKRELEEVADGKRQRLYPSLYDANDGIHMRAEPFGHPAGFKDQRGRLWFASSSGIIIVDPQRRVPAPAVNITEVRLGGQRIAVATPGAKVPVVKGAPFDLAVTFGTSSFAAEGTVLYRYRLQTADDGGLRPFVELGPSRTLFHAGLEAGDYQLLLEARSREGDWSGKVARIAFGLAPPFHRSPGFALLVAAVIGLALLAVHRARIARTRAGLQVVMAERARIAREIHDTLAQAFVATSVQLECLEEALEGDPGVSGPKIKRHLGTAKKVVEESLDEARRALWVLRPQSIESGLVPALETLVNRVSGGTAVVLEVTGTVRELSPLVASNLLRIAHEAVANALRHARARRIVLSLAFLPAVVTLSVADDGKGIEAQQEAQPGDGGGQGILGMKERAAQMGGRLTIAGTPERGTTVQIEVAA